MSTNFKSKGDMVNVTLDGTYASGVGISLSDRAGVVSQAGVVSDIVPVALEGIFRLAKLNTDTVAVGQKLYWHTVSKYVTTSSSGAKAIGWAAETQAVSGTALCDVKLGAF